MKTRFENDQESKYNVILRMQFSSMIHIQWVNWNLNSKLIILANEMSNSVNEPGHPQLESKELFSPEIFQVQKKDIWLHIKNSNVMRWNIYVIPPYYKHSYSFSDQLHNLK